MDGFIAATAYLPRGWELIRQRGIRRYVLMPLAVNVLVFAGLGWWLWSSFDTWLASFEAFDGEGEGAWLVLEWLGTLVRIVGALALLVVSVYLFTFGANLIAAPFNGLLSERVERHLLGQPPAHDTAWSEFFRNLPRTITGELRKWAYVLMWLVPLLLLQWIPPFSFVAPLLLFVFGAWVLAIEYVDYPMGNRGHDFSAVRTRLRAHRGIALGFGTATALLTLVPIVNLVAMPIAVAGATALYLERMNA